MFRQLGYQPQPVAQNAFGFTPLENTYGGLNAAIPDQQGVGAGIWGQGLGVDPTLGGASANLSNGVASYGGAGTPPASTGFGLNTNTFSALGSIAQGAGALVQGYTGFKQLGIAKDQLAFQKDVFAKNWANQVATTNSQLRDRQNARRGASSSYQGTDEYLQQNQVK